MGIIYTIIYYMTLPFTAFHTLINNIPGAKKLGTISVPMRIALLVFLFLFVMLISFCVSFQFSETAAQWRDYLLNWKAGPAVLVLMILIPVVSYYVVKIWLEGDTSEYPDIDKAWKQGLEALDKHGISIATTPLFLVIGNADERRAVRSRGRVTARGRRGGIERRRADHGRQALPGDHRAAARRQRSLRRTLPAASGASPRLS
jgi:hypothetical protein